MTSDAELDALDDERERRRLAYLEQIRRPEPEYRGSDATPGRFRTAATARLSCTRPEVPPALFMARPPGPCPRKNRATGPGCAHPFRRSLAMMVELTETEVRDLMDALEVRLEGMMHELVRAENRKFRQSLRMTYDRLDRLRKRLDALLEQEQAYA